MRPSPEKTAAGLAIERQAARLSAARRAAAEQHAAEQHARREAEAAESMRRAGAGLGSPLAEACWSMLSPDICAELEARALSNFDRRRAERTAERAERAERGKGFSGGSETGGA